MTAPWQRSWLKSQNNPLIFVREVLGATPEPWQAEALEAVGQHDRVSIRSGHGVGKTTFGTRSNRGRTRSPSSDLNTLRVRIDLLDNGTKFEPGMTVWLNR